MTEIIENAILCIVLIRFANESGTLVLKSTLEIYEKILVICVYDYIAIALYIHTNFHDLAWVVFVLCLLGVIKLNQIFLKNVLKLGGDKN